MSDDSIVSYWHTRQRPVCNFRGNVHAYTTHTHTHARTYMCVYVHIHTFLHVQHIPYVYVYPRVSAEGLRGATSTEGWRWCWKETESIPIGPLWYSGATMPAIGRRSTKPLNDPPWRTGATATLFQSRKSSCPPRLLLAVAPSASRPLLSRALAVQWFQMRNYPIFRY